MDNTTLTTIRAINKLEGPILDSILTTIQAINKLEGPILDSIHAYGQAKQMLGEAQTTNKIARTDTFGPAGKADDTRNAALVLIASAITNAEAQSSGLPVVSGKFHVRGTYSDHGNIFLNTFLGRYSRGGAVTSWAVSAGSYTIQENATHTFAEAVAIAKEARSHPHYCQYPVTIEPAAEVPGAKNQIAKLEADLAAARQDIGAKQRKIDSQAGAIRSLETKVKDATTVLTADIESKCMPSNIKHFAWTSPRYFVVVDYMGTPGKVLYRDGSQDGLCSSDVPAKLSGSQRERFALELDAAKSLANDARGKRRYSNVLIVPA